MSEGAVSAAKARRPRKRKTRASSSTKDNNKSAKTTPSEKGNNATHETQPPPNGPNPAEARSTSTIKPVQYTLSRPEWHYIHLTLQHLPGLASSSSSTAPSAPPREKTQEPALDALTLRQHLLAALSSFLGEHGAAIPLDVLHIFSRSEHTEHPEHPLQPQQQRQRTSKSKTSSGHDALLRVHARDAQLVLAAIAASASLAWSATAGTAQTAPGGARGGAGASSGEVVMRVLAAGSWPSPLAARVNARSRGGSGGEGLFVFERPVGSVGSTEAAGAEGAEGVGTARGEERMDLEPE